MIKYGSSDEVVLDNGEVWIFNRHYDPESATSLIDAIDLAFKDREQLIKHAQKRAKIVLRENAITALMEYGTVSRAEAEKFVDAL